MKLTAFVSDIHANLEALQAVIEDIDRLGAGRVYCLGDVVNYGPDPAACLRIVRSMDLCLMGNHEEAVLSEPIGFNPVAAEAAKWTKRVLKPSLVSHGGTCANWDFITELPLRHETDRMLFVHASPRNPTAEYILPNDADTLLGEPTEKMTECFALIKHLCFVGHTHLPGVFPESGGFLWPREIRNEYAVRPGEKAIINVGSVGQPRDRNPRACYATFDGEVVRYRRVEYNMRRTCAKVLASRLPDWCGLRLLKGE